MHRREFITLFATTAAAWPLAARAQQAKARVISFLGTTSPSAWSQPVAAFEQRLGELGWVAGRTITIDYRWTQGRTNQPLAISQPFFPPKLDIIFTGANAVSTP